MKEQAHEILSTLSGNSGSTAVASATLAAGGMSLLAQVQSWIGVGAVALGAVLSLVLIVKNLREMRYSKEKHAKDMSYDEHIKQVKLALQNTFPKLDVDEKDSSDR